MTHQISEDLLEEARFINSNGELEKAFQPRYRFPAVFVLSGHDSSESTAYRLCLYAAIKLDQTEMEDYLN
jgi:hypothetical protein